MTFNVLVKPNQFTLLVKKPEAWQLLLPSNSGIKRNDNIMVKEVDSNLVLTGNEKKGIVLYIDCGIDIKFSNGSVMYYICPVLIGVGDLTIGGTFVIG